MRGSPGFRFLKARTDMKKYKALIMDFDLTIADTSGIISEALRLTAREFGYEVSREDMRRGIGCLPSVIFARSTGVADEGLLARMEERYYVNSYPLNLYQTKFFPGVREGLALLRERGIKAAIYSQKQSDLIIPPLEREGIAPYVDAVIGIHEVKNTKPSPEGIEIICSRFGISPADVLYTGDAITDEQTAVAAGVDFAPLLCGVTPAERFDRERAVGVYEDLYALCADMAGEKPALDTIIR